MENVKYRIKEYCGEFTIQIYAYEEKGFLWWKKKEWRWSRTNAYGGVWPLWPWLPISETYKTLEEAQQQVNNWQVGPIYHNF